MDRLDALPPDQRAVVALVLQRGRSYEDLAALLGIPLAAVRGRAVRGITALAGGLDAGGREGEVADWLLGQGGEPPGLAADAGASAFAAAAAGALRALPGASLPAVPGSGSEESEPETPAAGAEPASAQPAEEGAPPGDDPAADGAAQDASQPAGDDVAADGAAQDASQPAGDDVAADGAAQHADEPAAVDAAADEAAQHASEPAAADPPAEDPRDVAALPAGEAPMPAAVHAEPVAAAMAAPAPGDAAVPVATATPSPADAAAANGAPPPADVPRARPREARAAGGDGRDRRFSLRRSGPGDAATGLEDTAPAASRLGGALLIALLTALVAVGLFLVVRGGSDDAGPTAADPEPTAAATPSEPQAVGAIPLREANNSGARGQMTIFAQGDQLLFTIEGERLRPNKAQDGYAVWFLKRGSKAQRLGYAAPVGKDGKLGLSGPPEDQAADFPQLLSTYDEVVVSRETDDRSVRPSRAILRGRLPGAQK